MVFSFIHISDIHLGRPFTDISEYAYNNKISTIYNQAVEKSFNNFINFAIEKNVDFVLIAGDTFDNCEQDFKSKLLLKEGLLKLSESEIKVFLICGNHDPISAYNKNTFNFDENSNIKIIGVNTSSYGTFPVYDRSNTHIANINAMSYFENHYYENPLKQFSTATDNQIFNIGLLHCDIDGAKDSPYAPCSSSELSNYNYNYWALGHIHIPDNNRNTYQYSGTIQGRNTKETGAHGFKYIKVEDNKIIENSFIPADIIRFENIDIDLSKAEDTTSAYETIKTNITIYNDCELYLLKLNLTGTIPFYTEINEEFFNTTAQKLHEDFDSKICISEFINNLSPKIEEKLLQEDDGISGEIYKNTNIEDIKVQIQSITNEPEIKKLINDFHITPEEINKLQDEAAKIVKDECINIAGQIYYNELTEGGING